ETRGQSDTCYPFRDEPRVLPCRDAPVLMAPAWEQEVAGFCQTPSGTHQWLPAFARSGFPLSDTGTSDGDAVWSNILDLDVDHVTAAELAIDSKIEHGEVADPGI